MTDDLEKHAHRKDITFREAEGIDPLPKMLAYGELDRRLRNRIWDVLFSRFSQSISIVTDYPVAKAFEQTGYKIAVLVLREVSHYPMDEAEDIASDPSKFIYHLKEIVLKGKYYDCLDLVQYFLRLSSPPWRIASALAEVLDDPLSPYLVIDFPPKTIVPRGDENERAAFDENWVIIKTSPLENAKTHLREAAERLNQGDARGAIREAITAVEGAARVITGNPKATLGDALGVLQKDKGLHSALKAGFSSLYGYTSDENGIRHALMDGDNANVGQDEALFMFSACTAFVAYLARKYPEKV